MSPEMGGYTPADHASRHEDDGRDEMSIAGLLGEPATLATHKADYELHSKKVYKAADETVNNSATLQNDDDLLFAIGANEIWELLVLVWVSSNSTANFQYKVTAPSGAAGHADHISQDGINTKALGAGHAFTCSEDPYLAEAKYIVVNSSTAGNVQLQWAQNTKNASDTTLKAGSCLIAHQLA